MDKGYDVDEIIEGLGCIANAEGMSECKGDKCPFYGEIGCNTHELLTVAYQSYNALLKAVRNFLEDDLK
mgnify:CR=1 FL=1